MIKWFEKAVAEERINKFEFKQFTKSLSIDGDFGAIYKCEWKDIELTVALKCLNIDVNSNERTIQNLILKLKLLQKVCCHPNIIGFYGITSDDINYYMVLEFATDRNLRKYLEKNFMNLQWTDKLRIAKEIVMGLMFLHNNNIVHQDLHSKNILISQGQIKITDLGLSKRTNEILISSSSTVHEMPAYIEPQCSVNKTYKCDKKSDIYSLGVILWEISSGKPPFQFFEPTANLHLHIYQGNREEPIEGTPPKYVDLYKNCWDNNPDVRPETKLILVTLNQLISDIKSIKNNDSIENFIVNETLNSNNQDNIIRPYLDITPPNSESSSESPSESPLESPLESSSESLKSHGAVIYRLNVSQSQSTNSPQNFKQLHTSEIDKYKETLSDLNKLLEINPNHLVALRNRGVTYRKMGRYEDSLTDFNKLLELDPNNTKALRNRSETYAEMNKFDESLADLDKSLEINPNDTLALADRGLIYKKICRYEESLADFTKSLEFTPNDDKLVYNKILGIRGIIHREMGRYEESLMDLNKALEIIPNDALMLSTRGFTYQNMRRYEESLADYNKSLELLPDDVITLNNRGAAYLCMGRYEESLADYNKSLEINPNNLSVLGNRGLTFQKMGRYKESIEDLNNSLEIDPVNAAVLSTRGISYYKMGKYKESLADLDKSLEIESNEKLSAICQK
ncbi:kinase-like domain-containing protein [Gigaspora rosea]|uniref:Kinase-like domain-containing protein n=1 Tax=Gigaspora rosea TaxID=44941 RepID=A0A397W904_9GLOM|nr:kinase-like domain-containing protein [Gigaspora rosea]